MRERHDEIKATGASPLPFRPDRDSALGRLRELRGHWKPLSAILDPDTRAAGNVYSIEPAPIERESGLLQTQGSAGFFKSGEGEGEGEGEPFACVGEGCPIGFYDLTETFPTCAAPLATGHIAIDEMAETICVHVSHSISDATYFAFHDSAGQVIEAHPIVGSTFDYQWTLSEFLLFEEDIDYITIQSTTYPSGAVVGVLECPYFPEPVACSATLSAAGVTESAVVDFAMDMDVDTLALSMEVTHDLGGDAVLELLSVTGEVTQSFPAVPTGFTYAFTPWEMAALWQPGAFDTIRISGGTAEVTLSGAVSCVENLGDIYYCPIELDGDGAGTASPYTGSGYLVLSLLSGYRGILLEHNVPDATEVQFITDTNEAIVSLPLSGPILEEELTPCQWDMYVAGNVGSIRIATHAQPMGAIGGAILCDGAALALYSPGCITPVAVTIENPESAAIAALGLELSLPEGWSFIEVTGPAKPETPNPALVGKTVPLLWVTPPSFPADFTIYLEAPVGASLGTQGFASYLRFFDANNSGLNIQTPPLRQLDHSLCIGALQQPVYAAAPPQYLGTPPGDSQSCIPEAPQIQPYHSADRDQSNTISLSELLRLVQFFNAGGYHCNDPSDPPTEDGYVPFGDENAQCCLPHSSDYQPQDWVISLNEVLRAVQFFNLGGYRMTGSWSEDGFRPGLPLPAPTTWQEEVEAFLDFIEEDASIETFDSNEYGYDIQGNIEFYPNGIPDAAEFGLLEYIRNEDTATWHSVRGIKPHIAQAVWEANMTQAANDLSNIAELPGFQFAIAAYMTIADLGSRQFVKQVLAEEANIDIDFGAYDNFLSQYLGYKGNADDGALRNFEIYDAMQPAFSEWELYARAASGMEPFDLSKSAGGGSKSAVENTPCEADCREDIELHVAVLPSGAGSVEVKGEKVDGEGNYYKQSSVISVTAVDSPGYVFKHWVIPDTLAHLSRSRTETFVLAPFENYQGITAIFVSRETVEISWTVGFQCPNDSATYGEAIIGPCSRCELGEVQVTSDPSVNDCNLLTAKQLISGPANEIFRITSKPTDWNWWTITRSNMTSRALSATVTMSGQTQTGGAGFTPPPGQSCSQHTPCASLSGRAEGDGYVAFGNSATAPFVGSISFRVPGGPIAFAVANDGWEFERWDDNSTNPTRGDLYIEEDTTIVAHFKKKDALTLSVDRRVEGDGADEAKCAGYVAIDPAKKYYELNDEVTLVAEAFPGYLFVRWEGDLQSPIPVKTLVMDSNKSVTAVFKKLSCEFLVASHRFEEDPGLAVAWPWRCGQFNPASAPVFLLYHCLENGEWKAKVQDIVFSYGIGINHYNFDPIDYEALSDAEYCALRCSFSDPSTYVPPCLTVECIQLHEELHYQVWKNVIEAELEKLFDSLETFSVDFDCQHPPTMEFDSIFWEWWNETKLKFSEALSATHCSIYEQQVQCEESYYPPWPNPPSCLPCESYNLTMQSQNCD